MAPTQIVLTGDREGRASLFDIKTKVWKIFDESPDKFWCGCGVGTIERKLYLVGGWDDIKSKQVNAVDAYEANTGKWISLPPLIEARTRCAVVLNENETEMYALGGWDGEVALNEVEVLDLKTKKEWKKLPSMLKRRSGCSAVFHDNKIIVIGGFDERNILATGEIFDLTTQKWSLLPSQMTEPRRCFGLTKSLKKNQIYAVGGHTGANEDKSIKITNTVDMLDISEQSWTSLPPAPLSGLCRAQMILDENNNEILYAMIGKQLCAMNVETRTWSVVSQKTPFDLNEIGGYDAMAVL